MFEPSGQGRRNGFDALLHAIDSARRRNSQPDTVRCCRRLEHGRLGRDGTRDDYGTSLGPGSRGNDSGASNCRRTRAPHTACRCCRTRGDGSSGGCDGWSSRAIVFPLGCGGSSPYDAHQQSDWRRRCASRPRGASRLPAATSHAQTPRVCLRRDGRSLLDRRGHTRDLLGCLPGATTLLIPDVGHMPNLEAPDRFNRNLVMFLQRNAPGQ